jgi:hypothetical protein
LLSISLLGAEDFINAADKAMYEQETGGNRIAGPVLRADSCARTDFPSVFLSFFLARLANQTFNCPQHSSSFRSFKSSKTAPEN